jgi:hypothetical protein
MQTCIGPHGGGRGSCDLVVVQCSLAGHHGSGRRLLKPQSAACMAPSWVIKGTAPVDALNSVPCHHVLTSAVSICWLFWGRCAAARLHDCCKWVCQPLPGILLAHVALPASLLGDAAPVTVLPTARDLG